MIYGIVCTRANNATEPVRLLKMKTHSFLRVASACWLLVFIALPIRSEASPVGCRLNTPAAIGCANPDDAAAAFEKFGFDSKASATTNIRALLHRSQCIVADASFANDKITEFSSGKIATQNGWVPVLFVDYNDGEYPLYFAWAYITGTCEKFRPKTCTGHAIDGKQITECN